MKVVIELNKFKEEEYDFYNDKNEHIEGVKRTATLDGGFVLKFRTKEDMDEIKKLSDSEEPVACTIDKYGRIYVKK